jgi:hypothetical protein
MNKTIMLIMALSIFTFKSVAAEKVKQQKMKQKIIKKPKFEHFFGDEIHFYQKKNKTRKLNKIRKLKKGQKIPKNNILNSDDAHDL